MFKLIVYVLIIFFLNINFSFSSQDWSDAETDPKGIIDAVQSDVQDTELDNVGGDGVYGVLDSLRQNVGPYINWIVFIGLSVAVILIIYNGILLITQSMDESVLGKVKTRITYLVFGVIILTGFYFILAIVGSIIANVAG
ncbi:hypothetical protein [Candidatus Vampirococcus lugosii]|uniref:Uncharacterized protein n=1 Tax=Candidatus Vampirococcus lugosii TaxID=2789015 RepID=A0ABS5QL11_9BACT|nr:hypothetical protein [Candidatus Vampirococcus lugosii]MBS8121752.1 hypothetical protein [Candidatus Vampirococcus lugosii]